MIHCFELNGAYLVHDAHSRALHMVSPEAYEVLCAVSQRFSAFADPGSAIAALQSCTVFQAADMELQAQILLLVKQNRLFSSQNPSLADYMLERRPVLKALCLHMNSGCNLRCKYCFLSKRGTHEAGMQMEPGTACAALDLLVASSQHKHNLEVDFFGGEPLLDFDTLRCVTEYGRSLESKANKRFRFTLTTNAMLLDTKYYDFINSQIDNVVLSLDGRPHVHDNMRVLQDGSGTFDTVFPKIIDFVGSRGPMSYYVRGTFTSQNLDFASDVLYLADMGIKNISVEPVVCAGVEHSIQQEHIPQIRREYARLAYELVKRTKGGQGFNFFHFAIAQSGGPCAAKQLIGCGAGSEYAAIAPNGDMYPCHQLAYDSRFLIGNVERGIEDHGLIDEFLSCNVLSKNCSKCWAYAYCSGGCMATAFYGTGSIFKPDAVGCELQKARIEAALYVAAMLKDRSSSRA